jgi:hypothetical protein
MHMGGSPGFVSVMCMIARDGTIAEDFDLLDVAAPVQRGVAHLRAGGGKFLFAERRSARSHENHIVRHQRENGRDIAGFGGRHPRLDQRADVPFVVGHRRSHGCGQGS